MLEHRYLCTSHTENSINSRTPLSRFRQRSAQLGRIVRGLPGLLTQPIVRRPDDPLRLRFAYDDIGAPARYRVDNQIEQARIAGFAVQAAPLDGPANPYDLTLCDLLYLYRLPLTPRTWPLVPAARRFRIPIIFDTDDLVWDPADRQFSYLDDHYSPKVVARILRTIRRTHAMMRQADALVFATPYLARHAAQTFRQPGYVNANALSQAMVEAAATAYSRRQTRATPMRLTIGYFSGTPRVHEEDLASIAPALCTVLDQHPDVMLRIYGSLQLMCTLADPRYAPQIEQRPLVSWSDLSQHIAQMDINIAPL